MPTYVPTYTPAYLCTCLPTYLPTYVPTYVLNYLRTCLLTYLFNYTYLPALHKTLPQLGCKFLWNGGHNERVTHLLCLLHPVNLSFLYGAQKGRQKRNTHIARNTAPPVFSVACMSEVTTTARMLLASRATQ